MTVRIFIEDKEYNVAIEFDGDIVLVSIASWSKKIGEYVHKDEYDITVSHLIKLLVADYHEALL